MYESCRGFWKCIKGSAPLLVETCQAQHWSLPWLIKIWLSRLPRSNVISVTRKVEEGWSRKADCSPALLPWPVPLIPASVERPTVTRSRWSPPSHRLLLTSDDFKLLQKFPVSELKTRLSFEACLAVMGCDRPNVRTETSNEQYARSTVEWLCCFLIPRAF